MSIEIYLRPLMGKDAFISYRWRNNPEIWKFTGSKPDKVISKEIELEWIKKVLKRNNEKRYAICVEGNDKYIGNVQLANIKNKRAEFHIFIGNTNYWGKGIAKQATNQILNIAFNNLHLDEVYLKVTEENTPAIKVYKACGFEIVENNKGELLMKKFSHE